jgi:hypothetical protein
LSNLPDPDDIFDLDTQRSIPHFDFGVEEVSTRSPVRKPQKDEFFRVHPGEDFTTDLTLLEHNTGEERNLYMVSPVVAAELRTCELSTNLKRVRIFTVVNRGGTVFLWPQTLPTGDKNSGRTWHESALEVADAAVKFWVKMAGDRAVGAYKFWKASGDLGEPKWGALDLQALIRIGFKERAITTTEHEAVRQLRGEI